MKQILLALNEQKSFIIEDLDDYHLVIRADDEAYIRKLLEDEVCLVAAELATWLTTRSQLEKNTYTLE